MDGDDWLVPVQIDRVAQPGSIVAAFPVPVKLPAFSSNLSLLGADGVPKNPVAVNTPLLNIEVMLNALIRTGRSDGTSGPAKLVPLDASTMAAAMSDTFNALILRRGLIMTFATLSGPLGRQAYEGS